MACGKKVLKFGGTSVGSPERIREAARITVEGGQCRAVVVSAFAGVTDLLVELGKFAERGHESFRTSLETFEERCFLTAEAVLQDHKKEVIEWYEKEIAVLRHFLEGVYIIRDCSARSTDYVLSFGERLSAFLFAHALKELGAKAEFVDAVDLIKTDSSFGCAAVREDLTSRAIQERFGCLDAIASVPGFIGLDGEDYITTLGRGGSDLTAAILGAALGADEIEIWTDVDGIMTCDPRLVPTAMPIPTLSYEEAMELSHFGAKVLYPPTIQPALAEGIPIRIRNSLNPSFAGSVIADRHLAQGAHDVTAISSISEIALLRVQGPGLPGATGAAQRVFRALAEQRLSPLLITQASSEHTICFAVLPVHAPQAAKAIEDEFRHEIARGLIDPVIAERDLSVLSVVGERMRHVPGISGRFFHALGMNGINVAAIAQGSSELNISAVISSKDRKKALNAVHDGFFLSDLSTAHLFVVGDGKIGSALLKQVHANRERLRDRYRLNLVVAGLTNTRVMAVDEDGLGVSTALELPEGCREKASLNKFIGKMLSLNLPHCVLVDCTASDEVAEQYQRIIDSSVSIVTPNKRALSSTMDRYEKLKAVEHRRGVRFFYETCVGAGLPIIGTLADLLKSGDEILAIEAVLSGTLSFIFNSYDGKVSFAEVVRHAQSIGYTEPDPRDDLSGLDVARKLLILAREAGWRIEFDDIRMEQLLPDECRVDSDLETFYEALLAREDLFRRRLGETASRGEKLCYIASLQDGKATVGLRGVSPDHPFFSLSGSDNIVSFRTKRYDARPLVVKGPGAGPDVTAAGVFADIIRVVQ